MMAKKKKLILKSTGINIFFLFFYMVFFEPFISITDFNEIEKIYGLYTGELDFQTKFVQSSYSRLVVFMAKLFPEVQWYTLIFVFLEFISLILISMFILSMGDEKITGIISTIIICLCAYEAYTHINFTKVAFITGAAGYLTLFSSKIRNNIAGGILICLSILIRFQVGELLFGLWIVTFLAENTLKKFVLKEKVEIKRVVKVGGLFLGIFFFFLMVPHMRYLTQGEKDYWKNVWEWNNYRALIQDFDVGKDAISVNDKISDNDYYIMYSWNEDYFRMEDMTIDVSEDTVGSPKLLLEMIDINNVALFFKCFPVSLLTIDFFWTCIAILLMLLCIKKENKKLFFTITVGMTTLFLIINYYLYVGGRYLQHRVDIGIILNVLVAYLYLLNSFGYNILRKNILVTYSKLYGALICLFLVLPYEYYSDDVSYISREQINENREFFEYTSKDLSKCYLIGNSRDDRAKNEMCYSPFEVPKIGIKENIIMGASPENETVRKNNNISNPYYDIVNNSDMFLVLDQSNVDQSKWEEYIGNTYGGDVKLVLKEEKYGRLIYSVVHK